mgnify:FL=1|tara:strand:- start:7303 stop:7584 length:282 start_codon:yes stop_codon:yes gene_type:complete
MTIDYQIGDVLEVETFAGVNILTKVKKMINKKSKLGEEEIIVKGFEGSFVRRKDLISLKKRSVPYTGKEVLKDTISFTYDSQIVKLIKRSGKN